MKLNKRLAGVVVLIGLLVGSLAIGAVLAGKPAAALAAPAAQATDPCAQDDDGQEAAETEDKDNVQEEVQCGSQEADAANEGNEVNEANESAGGEQNEQDGVVPADWTGLSLDEAKAIAENANPGAAVVDAEFDQENSPAVYDVEMDNGVDVKIDAMTGEIVTTEARD